MDLIERVQQKVSLVIFNYSKGTSRDKQYEELVWESLYDRRDVRHLTVFYKVKNNLAPSYLSDHIPIHNDLNINLRNRRAKLPIIRTDRYESSFFPYTIKLWNILDTEASSKPSVQSFKKYLNDFKRPLGHPLFGISDRFGTKLLTKIRVNFSDLRDHRFNHNFNCVNPLCLCGIEDESSVHYFLRCPRFSNQRKSLLSNVSDIINSDVTVLPNEHLYYILVYGSNVYNSITNKLIITESISYIRNTGRFTKLEAFS